MTHLRNSERKQWAGIRDHIKSTGGSAQAMEAALAFS
jgi:hypothetical protein